MIKGKEPISQDNFFNIIVVKSWWVLALALCAFLWCNHATAIKEKEIADLEYRLHEIDKEKKVTAEEKETLVLKLNSQDDPEWIEQLLMNELGLVPDGYTKVHFIK